MNVQHHQPQHETLQKHLEYYYVLRTEDSNFEAKYYAFPHIFTPLSIYQNAESNIKNYSTSVSASNKKNNVALIQGIRTKPFLVCNQGKTNEITLVFKPLGLNHFVRKKFTQICPKDSQIFTEWNEDIDYQEFLHKFNSIENQNECVLFLEEFLLKIYQPIENAALLEKSIELLTDFEGEKNIEEIAEEIGLKVRTFNRIFKENLGISPIGFRKIARFRHSLNHRFFNEQFKHLTDIAYHSNFYDQSYFIKIYKQMTGLNPKLFFEKVEKVGSDKLFFQFINQ